VELLLFLSSAIDGEVVFVTFRSRGPGACSAGGLDRCFYKGEKSFASVENRTTIPIFTARGLVALL
jgi:hypothetical protein